MKLNNYKVFSVLFFLFLFLGIIASLKTFEIARERSVHSGQEALAENAFDNVVKTRDKDAEPQVERKSEPTGTKLREMSPQTMPWSRNPSRPNEFSLLPVVVDRVQTMLISAAENSNYRERNEARSDEPDGAAKFRRLQMQDENGQIPIDGLQKAREQMDNMRAFYKQQARVAGKPDGMEVAGLAPVDWSWLGPGNIGGRIRSIVIDPNNPQNIWAGSVSGGIWKTANSGNTWQPVNDFMANLSVTTLIINPSNTAIMYAGTGEGFGNVDAIQGGGVFQSIDSGNTWNLLASTNPAAPNPPGCGVIGAVPCSAFWSYVNRLAIATNGVILAATNGGIARTVNGGTTWTQQTAVTAQDIDFDPSNSSNAVAGESTQCPTPPGPPCAASARFSNDGGVNWNAAAFNPPITNGGTSAADGRVELAYAPSSSNIVYASVNQNQGDIYQSTNWGQNFTKVDIDTPTPNNLLGTVGWYANALWVNPRDPTFLLVGGVNLFQSGDSGATFALKADGANGSAHSDHHAFVANPTFDDSADKSVYFGNDGGVFRVDDIRNFSRTSGWTERNNNLGITQFYGGAVTPNGVAFGGTQDNGTIRVSPTPNVDPPYNTENWMETFPNDGGVVAADPTDANYLFGEMQNMGIFRSSDGGATAIFIYCNPAPTTITGGICTGTGITDAFNGANFIAPFILDPSDPNTMLAGGLSLWRSTDVKTAGLPTWAVAMPPNPTIPPPGPAPTPLPAPNPISAIAVSATNSNLIVVGHNDGQIWLTVNGTNSSPTWNRVFLRPVAAAQPARIITRLTIDSTRTPNWIYATLGGFSADNIYVTKDLGGTWTDVTGSGATALPNVPVRSLVINRVDNNKIYVGTEVGIFASEDAGATWLLPQGGPANVSVDELFWYQGNLFAATHGRGIYKTNVPVIDFAICLPPPSDPRCPGTNFCPLGGGNFSCCTVGDWDCPCTWASKQVPNQNLDVDVACPITVRNSGVAKNIYVGNRLTLVGASVTAIEDVTNVGLIESAGSFSSGMSVRDLTNIRPSPAVTNAGIINLNDTLNISGDVANYGIITGHGINVNKSGAPSTFLHNLSGNGFWGSGFLTLGQTTSLASDVTMDVASANIGAFSKLRLNDFLLTSKGNFVNSGEVDLGTGTINFRGSTFSSSNPSSDPDYGIKGTGIVNFSPTSGAANLSVVGGLGGVPIRYQPSLRVLTGTVNANFQSSIGGSLTVDPGATFNFNEGTIDLHGDLTVNGTIGKTNSFTTTTLNFNGTNLTNNGSMFVDFLYFNNTNTPRAQSIIGNGQFGGTAAQIGLDGSPSTTSLTGSPTFNNGQFGIGNGSTLIISNGSTLTFTGSSFTNSGTVNGPGTLFIQPTAPASLSSTGSSLFTSAIILGSGTVTPSARVTGPFTINNGATLSGGSLIYWGTNLINNGNVTSTSLSFGSANFQPITQQFGGTGTFTGSSGQLFIPSFSTTNLSTDVTYAGPRLYNEGRLNASGFTFSMPCPSSVEGPGEVIGNFRRTNLGACSGPITFGNPFTTLHFTSGTPPSEISINTLLSAPAGFPNAATRTYFINPLGGGPYTAALRLHYLDSELNGNNETSLQLFRNNGTNWTAQGVTSRDTNNNWVEYAGVTQFSPWALSQSAPTAANVSISGRVTTMDGRGLRNAILTLTDPQGNVRSFRTGTFGYYHFDDVATGQTYVIAVTARFYQFTPRTLYVTDELTDINFISTNAVTMP